MWRLYGEIFVLVTIAFALGALVATGVIRLAVRRQAAPRVATEEPKASRPSVDRLRP